MADEAAAAAGEMAQSESGEKGLALTILAVECAMRSHLPTGRHACKDRPNIVEFFKHASAW